MSAAPRLSSYTAAEYLALDDAEPSQRYQYDAGFVWAMSGGTRSHALMGGNALHALKTALKGRPCRVYGPDLRVRTARGSAYTYPDVTVTCGEETFDGHTLASPLVLVEVLSDSTEPYDRGRKFQRVQETESVQAYVLLDQKRPLAEVFTRRADGWQYVSYRGLDAWVDVPPLGVQLAMADLYEGVEFPPDADDEPPLFRAAEPS